MRWVLFCFLILVAGCVAPGETEHEENITGSITIGNITEGVEPESEKEFAENETEEQEEAEEEPEEELPDETYNETVNETINETEEETGGILFGEGKYLFILEDLVLYDEESCAVVDIAYANGTSIKKDVMCPRTDYYWTAPDGHRFRIRILETAAGYTGESWASVIIYG